MNTVKYNLEEKLKIIDEAKKSGMLNKMRLA
jgi:hypothetical protein